MLGYDHFAEANDVVDVGCVALSENYLLGFLWGLFGLGYTAYTPYIFFSLLRRGGL